MSQDPDIKSAAQASTKTLPTLLLVDDSPAIHRLMAVKLKNEGIDFLAAYSGPEALELASELKPALIILDVNMPDMDGFEVLLKLKEDSETHDIPVIMLSGSDDSKDKVRSFELGAMDYVTKPFEVAELRARIAAAIRISKLMALLEKQASIDALTGLGNRAYFNRRLEEEVAKAERNEQELTLLMCDLDHFKKLNDNYGHPAGDAVLETFAQVLKDHTRVYDVPCRYGGEEFTILLPDTNLTEAVGIANRIRLAIEAESWPQYPEMRATGSFGAATRSFDGSQSPAAWLEAADQALYSAKTTGRNRVHFFDGQESGEPVFKLAS